MPSKNKNYPAATRRLFAKVVKKIKRHSPKLNVRMARANLRKVSF